MKSNKIYDIVIVGAGIVGLATAYKLSLAKKYKILLLEKEKTFSMHQTGNNSGVIHSGIYYKPNSKKAKNCKNGYKQLLKFCDENEINYDICGKVIVATKTNQLESLKSIYERGIENKLERIKMLNRDEVLDKEPYVSNCIKGIFVPQAGITDYKIVSKKLLENFVENGGNILFEQQINNINNEGKQIIAKTKNSVFKSEYLINCAGLYSDHIANLNNEFNRIKIIPFRGEYYKLKKTSSYLVKNLIYPVPDINLPFLGVHFTRRIDGMIEAGPNAVLAFKKEGYKFTDFNFKEFFEIILFPGFIKLGFKYFSYGISEIMRSLSKILFVKSLKELIPEIKGSDLERAGSGVRAQACDEDGNLIDDFLILKDKNIVNVINAPSPAATSCLSIADEIIKNLKV
jgi:(S)-2-hydroxyglutarate dehydrogenase